MSHSWTCRPCRRRSVGWLPDLLPSGYFTYCGCDPVANATINLDLLRLLGDFEIAEVELVENSVETPGASVEGEC